MTYQSVSHNMTARVTKVSNSLPFKGIVAMKKYILKYYRKALKML